MGISRPSPWRRCPLLLAAALVAGCGAGSTHTVTETTPPWAPTRTPTPTTTTLGTTSTASTPSPAKVRPSAPLGAPAPGPTLDCGTLAKGMVSRLTTNGGSCAIARTVSSSWLGLVVRGHAADGMIVVRADAPYACSARRQGQRAAVICERDDSPQEPRVVFVAHVAQP